MRGARAASRSFGHSIVASAPTKSEQMRAMSLLLRFHELIGGFSIPIDDTLDKINRKYSIILMLSLALPIITKQFVGDPIECFTPTYFTEAQTRYVNSFCWTASTYYIPPDNVDDLDNLQTHEDRIHTADMDFPSFEQFKRLQKKYNLDDDKWEEEDIVRVSYYQWAPIILLVQGALFHMPFVIWSGTASSGGVQLRRVLKKVREISQIPRCSPQRDSMVSELVEQFQCLSGMSRSHSRSSRSCHISCMCGRGPNRHLYLLYLFVKILYFANVWLQFFFLTTFLGNHFFRHGYNIASHMINRGQWWVSPSFPLQTLCKFRAINQGGGQMTFRSQCVLPINLFNEKIFSVVWFYLALLLPLNVYGIVVWVWRGLSCNRRSFIKYYLWRSGVVLSSDIKSTTDRLMFDYIGWDGVFVLRLIEHNHSTTILSDIFVKLWQQFSSSHGKATMCNRMCSQGSGDAERGTAGIGGGGHGAGGRAGHVATAPSAPNVVGAGASNTTWHMPFPITSAGVVPPKPARKSSKSTTINSYWDKSQ